MALYGLVSAALVSACCCWMLVLATEEKAVSLSAAPGPGTGAVSLSGNISVPTGNPSKATTDGETRKFGSFSVDSSMIQRALYVLIGITLTGLLYFLIRAVRLKKPVPKKKYGLLSDYDDSVEMDGGDSEEDNTLYEARGLRR